MISYWAVINRQFWIKITSIYLEMSETCGPNARLAGGRLRVSEVTEPL